MLFRIIIPEDQLKEKLAQACNILKKMRGYKKRWNEFHVPGTRKMLEDWEARADVFLESLETEPDPNFCGPEKDGGHD